MSDSEQDSVKFDEMNIALLRRIESDFDVSLDTLSEELDLSKSAIHYRINNLKENGVIEGVTADLDPVPFGLTMVAITEISVTHERGYSEEIGAKLAQIDGVEQVYYTMGDVDFITISRVQNREQMNKVIDDIVAIDGVNETSSRFVMDEVKSRPKVLANLSDNMQNNILNNE